MANIEHIEHIEDLLATAQKIEAGAAERYLEYAETASAENPEIAALFIRLAEEERKHEKCVLQLAEEASVDLSKITVSELDVPSTNSEDTPKSNDSIYQILAAAVKREELAFEIYSRIATSSENDELRHYSEILAKEELGHAALLRAMRRRVYNEHKAKTRQLPDPEKVNSINKFLITAILLEMLLAKYIENIDESGVAINSCREHSDNVINQLVADLGTDLKTDNIEQLSESMLSDITIFTLDNLMTECESVYEYYDSFVLKTENEAIMNKALFLASEMLTQLILLQDLKKNVFN